MRFIWLALSIMGPIAIVHLSEAESNQTISDTYLYVGAVFFIISIGLTITEFVKHRNTERHADNRVLLQERDEDIERWRKAFFKETSELFDAQKTMLTKAQELGEYHSKYQSALKHADLSEGENGINAS